jgi:glycosyltransferase involved in cell wall biosynthesis
MTTQLQISVVIPACNEQGNIQPLFMQIDKVMQSLRLTYEVIFVDDGSTDNTAAEVAELHQEFPQAKLISLSRNFGQQFALTAGMDYASGQAVISMDADLQHPPVLLQQLIHKWQEGYDIIYTIRASTADSGWYKKFASRLFYSVFDYATGINLPSNAADFRLLDRKVVEAFSRIRERTRFLRGLTAWVGFKSAAIVYEAASRNTGLSKYNFPKKLRLALDGLISFSKIPLYLAIYVGFAFSILGFLYAAYVIYSFVAGLPRVPGWASTVFLTCLIGGIQLILMGILGIYLGEIFDEVKQRPLYLVKRTLGFGTTKNVD